MTAIPVSIVDQVRAAAEAMAAMRSGTLYTRPDGTAYTPPCEVRRARQRYERADALRRTALHYIAEHGPQTLPGLAAAHPDVTAASWAWIARTLEERGHLHRVGAGHGRRHTALQYDITQAGRDALAAQTATTGDL